MLILFMGCVANLANEHALYRTLVGSVANLANKHALYRTLVGCVTNLAAFSSVLSEYGGSACAETAAE
jgi:hypothetical protein